MIVKRFENVAFAEMRGYEGVHKKIVLGPDDGSDELVLRHFSLEPRGKTPHHSHDFPHLVKIEAGNGVVTDESGLEHPLQQGDYVFISGNEAHHFANAGQEPFDFICIVPRRGEA